MMSFRADIPPVVWIANQKKVGLNFKKRIKLLVSCRGRTDGRNQGTVKDKDYFEL